MGVLTENHAGLWARTCSPSERRGALCATASVAMLFALLACSPQAAPQRDKPSPNAASLSPRTGTIVYASDRDGDYDLYLLNLANSRETKLTHDSRDDHSPSWSPDGDRIVFVRDMSHRNKELFVLRLGEAKPKRLTTSRTFYEYDPDWSPRGNWIAFARKHEAEGDGELALLRVSDLKTRTILIGNGLAHEPTWSPNADEIAFSETSGNSDINRTRPCCNDQYITETVTLTPADETSPRWSPTRDELLFGRDRLVGVADTDYDLLVTDLNGTEIRRLDSGAHNSLPGNWSVDGEWVVFYSDRGGRDYDIFVVPAVGGEAKRVTNTLANEIDPDWRP